MGFLPGGGGGGASGALALLSTTTISGSASAFSVTAIPGTYNDLIMVLIGRSNTAALNDNVMLTFNNDSGAHYGWQQLLAGTSSATASETNSTNRLQLGFCPAATATANFFGASQIVVPGYASTAWVKSVLSHLAMPYDIVTGAHTEYLNAGVWNQTAAVNRVDITPLNGLFVVGSQLRIYGRL